MERKFDDIKQNSEVLEKINKEVKDAHIKKSDVYNADSLMQLPWEPKSPLLEFGL
mgnify:CR=1 FL=1